MSGLYGVRLPGEACGNGPHTGRTDADTHARKNAREDAARAIENYE